MRKWRQRGSENIRLVQHCQLRLNSELQRLGIRVLWALTRHPKGLGRKSLPVRERDSTMARVDPAKASATPARSVWRDWPITCTHFYSHRRRQERRKLWRRVRCPCYSTTFPLEHERDMSRKPPWNLLPRSSAVVTVSPTQLPPRSPGKVGWPGLGLGLEQGIDATAVRQGARLNTAARQSPHVHATTRSRGLLVLDLRLRV